MTTQSDLVLKKNTSIEISQTNNPELLNPSLEIKLKALELEFLIDKIPHNSYICLFNKIFEDNNFVFMLNGKWNFFNAEENKVETWDWETDTNEILKNLELEQDFDGIKEFSDSWTLSDTQEFPYELDDLIKLESKSEYLDVSLTLSNIQTIEEKAIMILNTVGLSDLEKVNKILSLK